MKWQTSIQSVLIALILATACQKVTPRPMSDPARTSMIKRLSDFEDFWLAPARIAPPTIEYISQTQMKNGIEATIKPIRAEDQLWNQWDSDTVRLFNNRAAHIFVFTVRGPGTLKWVPEKTRLRLNWPEVSMEPALRADDLLEPLRLEALSEQQWMIGTDYTKRHRNAGSFRSKYLPIDTRPNKISGLVAFPIADYTRHVVAMQIDFVVQTNRGPVSFSWIYD